MVIKVLRMTLKDYNDLVESFGKSAKHVKVPSTDSNTSFHGCYTSQSQDEVAVAWPIDRPAFAQEEYADKYRCGFPVEEFDIGHTLN